jgi:cytochrome c553
MTRLMVFIFVLCAMVMALTMFAYKSLPVSNEKFDVALVEKTHTERQALIAELLAPKVVVEQEEVVVTEYAPHVDLNTPELERGAKLYSKCISCHGKGGEGKTSQKAPFIGGQYDWYIEEQLLHIQSGVRSNPVMEPFVKGLSAQDIKDLAAYVSKLPWKKEVPGAAE